MISLALGIAFPLELLALVSFSLLDLLVHSPSWLHIIVTLILFTMLVIFWGRFMAPKASHRPKPLLYYLSKTVVYCLAALVMWFKVSSVWAIAYILIVLLDEGLLFKYNVGSLQ